jgi:FtsP/CotA-like multicopper oxidase with cupredoxin domain
VRNLLSAPLRLHGLCTRPEPCAPIVIAPGDTREIRFSLDVPGTYFYWGSTSGETLATRRREDSQLGGAIVVDPREGGRNDRVMVISLLDDPPRISAEGAEDEAVFSINGASWPHTERLRYAKGERVHWRVINLSFDSHAMHLHGFHFDLESKGNIDADRPLPPGQTRAQVTEQMAPGTTFTLSWTPTRGGNWIFHCHMVAHMMAKSNVSHAGHGSEADGMAGLVMGIQVKGGLDEKAAPTVPRRFTLVLREEPNRYGSHPGYRMDVEGIDAPRLDAGPVPGPVLVLERGAPVEINVVNKLSEPSAIHWHGIELDSYFDGVPGFGGREGAIAPPIAAGAAFVAKFSPPRAGTFIYHTHWHDEAQLAGGLYGALIVLEPGEQYDPTIDHIILIGLNGVLTDGEREPFALNGRAAPSAVNMRAGVPNRLRFINITPNNVALTVSLEDRFETIMWKPVAKDGAVLVAGQSAPGLARQLIRRDIRLRDYADRASEPLGERQARQRRMGDASAHRSSLNPRERGASLRRAPVSLPARAGATPKNSFPASAGSSLLVVLIEQSHDLIDQEPTIMIEIEARESALCL